MKPETMVLELKQEHIDRGIRGSCDCCPVALAFKELGYSEVQVSYITVRLDGILWNHNQETEQAIIDYEEEGKPMKPATLGFHRYPDNP